MIVQVFYRNVYGRVLCYPANDNAAILAKIAGKGTFTNEEVKLVEMLGFKVETVLDPRLPSHETNTHHQQAAA